MKDRWLRIREAFAKVGMSKLILLFAAGICLMLLPKLPFFSGQTEPETLTPVAPLSETSGEGGDYEREMETRLESILSLVEGAGEVKVLMTVSNSGRTEYLRDGDSSESLTEETDAEGGKRSISETNGTDMTVIVRDTNGKETPLVLDQSKPLIEGIIIVSEGGDSIYVKDALIKAASAVLNVPLHKIQVLKMK